MESFANLRNDAKMFVFGFGDPKYLIISSMSGKELSNVDFGYSARFCDNEFYDFYEHKGYKGVNLYISNSNFIKTITKWCAIDYHDEDSEETIATRHIISYFVDGNIEVMKWVNSLINLV